MKRIITIVSNPLAAIFFLVIFLFIVFQPVFLQNKTLLNGNLLVSFYNPWAKDSIPGWETGIPNKPVGIDDLRIFYPQRFFTLSSFYQGILPLWNPFNFSGNNHIGLSETAVFYPLNLFFFIFPQLVTWDILIMVQPVIAAVGMLLFLRSLSLPSKSIWFGTLAFSLSGIIVVRMVEGLSVGHSVVWLPYVFWSIREYLDTLRGRYLFALFCSLLLSFLAGWFQFTFYLFVSGICYALYCIYTENLWRRKKKRVNKSVIVFLPFLLAPLASVYHLIPSFQTFLHSARSIDTYQILSPHLLPFQHIITYLAPDFWGNPGAYNFFGKSEYKETIIFLGVPPFLLSLLTLIQLKKDKTILFFWLLITVSSLFAFDNPISRLILLLPLPFVSSFLPSRIMVLATFSFAALASYGINILFSEDYRKKAKSIFLLLSIPLFLLAVVDMYIGSMVFLEKALSFFGPRHDFYPIIQSFLNSLYRIGLVTKPWQIMVQLKNLVLPHVFVIATIFLIFILIKTKKTIVIFFIIALLLLNQFYFIKKYLFFSEREFIFPDHPVLAKLQSLKTRERIISIGEGYIPSNFLLLYKLYSPDGVASMYEKRYGELVAYTKTKGESTAPARIETRIDPTVEQVFLQKDPYLHRFLQIDNVRYIVALQREIAKLPEGSIDETAFPVIWQNDKWVIFENKDALPRYFWTNQFKVIKDDIKLLKALYRGASREVILEKDPGIHSRSYLNETAMVRVLSYEPNKLIFEVDAQDNGLFYLSDTYTKNWRVLVDKKPEDLLRANFAFRAVPIKAGKHIIVFEYDTRAISVGFIIAGVAMAGGGVAFLLANRRKKILW